MSNHSTSTRDRLIYIVDADADTCERISVMFRLEGFSTAYFTDERQLLSALGRAPPDIVLMSVEADNSRGLSVLSHLKRFHGALPVFSMVGRGSVEAAVQAMKYGAWDVVTKPLDSVRLLGLVLGTPRNRSPTQSPNSVAHDVEITGFPALTAREREVMNLIVNGESSKSAALVLGISFRTVDVHRQRVMSKVGAENTADLIRIALTSR